MAEQTKNFLIKLSEDPETVKRFRKDPRTVMREFNVPEAHQALILAGDKEGLKKEAGLDDTHANFIIV